MLRRSVILGLLTLAAARCFALYDPKPDEALASVQGAWQGSLTYRDYSRPDRLVTLPTRLFVALGGPNVLVLQFTFDDGPSKKVYSYERMAVDLQAMKLSWSAGDAGKSVDVYSITAISKETAVTTLSFERQADDKTERHLLVMSPQQLQLSKEELQGSGDAVFRNRYQFSRSGS